VRVEAGANGRHWRSAFVGVKPSRSASVPSSRDAFGTSGLNVLNCEAKRRWSGISGDYDAELWVIGVLSLRATPRVQNPTISVRAGGGIPGEVYVTRSPVSPTDRTQHNNSEHNVNNHLNVSVLPYFRSIYDPFNVRESILARPHTERSRHLGMRGE
jgi:hypothetical protein